MFLGRRSNTGCSRDHAGENAAARAARPRLAQTAVTVGGAAAALTLPDPPATLQVREIERILDFLQVKVIGQGPMTRAKCVEYWGKEQDVCKELSN